MGWLSLATRRHPLESGPLKCCMINKTWWMYVKSISSVCLSLSILPGDFILKLAKTIDSVAMANAEIIVQTSDAHRRESQYVFFFFFFLDNELLFCIYIYRWNDCVWLRIRLTHANMKIIKGLLIDGSTYVTSKDNWFVTCFSCPFLIGDKRYGRER